MIQNNIGKKDTKPSAFSERNAPLYSNKISSQNTGKGFQAKLVALKPTSPGQRFRVVLKDPSLSKNGPVKHLSEMLFSKAGRSRGRITSAHRVSKPKSRYRFIDFKRNLTDPLRVESLERDPRRSARVALVRNEITGKQSYILAHESIKIDDVLHSGMEAPVKMGNRIKLGSVPEGTTVFQLEFKINKGAQCARAAGTGCVVLGAYKEDVNYIRVRMASKKERLFHRECSCVVGTASNPLHRRIRFSKASHSLYFKGRRPWSRGISKNPVDHCMGGRSNSKQGRSQSGLPSKGYKTVRKKSRLQKIVKRS
jgi:large subunit ribosomal protein L2